MNKKTTPGRKPALSVRQQRHIVRLSEEKDFSLKQLAALYGVSYMTIHRIVKKSLDTTPEQKACKGQAISQQQVHDIRPRIYSSYVATRGCDKGLSSTSEETTCAIR